MPSALNRISQLVNSDMFSLIDEGLGKTAIKRQLRDEGYRFADNTFNTIYNSYTSGQRIDLSLYADYETVSQDVLNTSSIPLQNSAYRFLAEVVGVNSKTGEVTQTTWFLDTDSIGSIEEMKVELANDIEARYFGPGVYVQDIIFFKGYKDAAI